MKKTWQHTILLLLGIVLLSGCNSLPQKPDELASACEQGIAQLDLRLQNHNLKVHQTNISRANSLLEAAQVQSQFAEYPGCLEKIQRAQDYLSGRKTAIISRLDI